MRWSKRFVKGLIYFPLMTDIGNSESIRVLMADHGNDGFACLMFLWSGVYGNDYFKKFSSREKKLFCSNFKFEIDKLEDILKTCFTEQLFNKVIFDKYEILTSRTIQEIWLDITYRRQELEIIKEFMLIELDEIKDNKRVRLVDINNKLIKASSVPQKHSPEKDKPTPAKKQPEIRTYTYQDVLDFIAIPYEAREDVFKETYSREDYKNYVALNNKINERYDGLRKSNRQLTFFEYGEFINDVKPTPTILELESAFKKMATLGVSGNADIYLRLGECLDMIRKPFIKNGTSAHPVEDIKQPQNLYRDLSLETEVYDFWGFTEISNPNQCMLFVSFLTVLKDTGQLENFRHQLKYYIEFKLLTGIHFKHSLKNFIGQQSNRFEDGKWLDENWEKKLTEEKSKKSKDVTGRESHKRGETPVTYGKI